MTLRDYIKKCIEDIRVHIINGGSMKVEFVIGVSYSLKGEILVDFDSKNTIKITMDL